MKDKMYSSFSTSLCFILILFANFVIQVENKSVFGIGTRIIGDQLLLKDILQTPPISLTEEPVIKFNYAIVEPITYIEIESDKNVYAIVNFSYEDNLVEGTISSINGQQQLQEEGVSKPEPFEVLIQIYGFNRTMLNVSPAYILNKDQQFNGVLKPNYQQKSLSLMQEDLNDLDEEYDEDDAIDDDDTDDNDNIEYEEEDEFDDNYDKVIEQGQRQEGDFLVYETNQTSATTTELPTNHSLTFYYIDIYYITYVKFTIYEHYLYHSINDYGDTYVVEYGHISPTTLKAVVTDHRTTSLFVQMQMYGFHPTALPVDYKPFLSNSQTSAATARPISSLRKLQILMNSQQSSANAQQQHPTELGHQIAPNNNSNNNNCMQQVLSASSNNIGNDCLSIFAHWSIFNLIVTIFVTMSFM
ncbi:uncharacterized protein LOC119602261 isoform X1 [Lucilia sericata]|uniref:uncharacterized protein LOC119602261 isoform X1 n=2 Tax=Lucilia sericata TaxID=13632 RepID=UPI0018A87775|nr:uncharacterized protein LOC119602261 isoform X1 [Lucilia sericata]